MEGFPLRRRKRPGRRIKQEPNNNHDGVEVINEDLDTNYGLKNNRNLNLQEFLKESKVMIKKINNGDFENVTKVSSFKREKVEGNSRISEEVQVISSRTVESERRVQNTSSSTVKPKRRISEEIQDIPSRTSMPERRVLERKAKSSRNKAELLQLKFEKANEELNESTSTDEVEDEEADEFQLTMNSNNANSFLAAGEEFKDIFDVTGVEKKVKIMEEMVEVQENPPDIEDETSDVTNRSSEMSSFMTELNVNPMDPEPKPKRVKLEKPKYEKQPDDLCYRDEDLQHNKTKLFPTERESKHYTLACKHCKFVTKYWNAMEEHNIRHTRIEEVRKGVFFFCIYCDAAFKSPGAKSTHIQDTHASQKKKCDYCHRSPHITEYRNHVKSYHAVQNRNYYLTHPNFAVEGYPRISGQNLNGPTEEQTCAVCGYSCKNLAELLTHYCEKGVLHYPECIQCKERYRSWKEHQDHILFHHNNEWRYKCGICIDDEYVAKTQEELETHFNKVHKKKIIQPKMPCDVCGKYISYSAHKAHNIRFHGMKHAKMINCDQCTFVAYSEKAISTHKEKSHTFVSCEICGVKIVTININLHMTAAHNIGGKFSCTKCDKKFGTKSHFEGHMNAHLGRKPFACKHCDQRFSDSSNERNHVKQVHLGIKRVQVRK